MNQAQDILAVLEAAGQGMLIEREPSGWRVETEEGYMFEGHGTLVETLGQVAQVLSCELAAPELMRGVDWLHDAPDDVDGTCVAIEAPVEFCPVIPTMNEHGRYTAEYRTAFAETEEGPLGKMPALRRLVAR